MTDDSRQLLDSAFFLNARPVSIAPKKMRYLSASKIGQYSVDLAFLVRDYNKAYLEPKEIQKLRCFIEAMTDPALSPDNPSSLLHKAIHQPGDSYQNHRRGEAGTTWSALEDLASSAVTPTVEEHGGKSFTVLSTYTVSSLAEMLADIADHLQIGTPASRGTARSGRGPSRTPSKTT